MSLSRLPVRLSVHTGAFLRHGRPVFRAELFGAMKEGTSTAVVRVDDMEADVFRALLHFVYTDTLQEDCHGVKQQKEAAMAQHLLVTADRYNLERLKLICEEKLCKHIDAVSVATSRPSWH